jgi:predicted PurR-regulated permease PerM
VENCLLYRLDGIVIITNKILHPIIWYLLQMIQKAIALIPPEFRWGLFFPMLFLNVWLLLLLIQQVQPLATIVVLAILFAFLLDYPIGFLEKLGLRRVLAVVIVFVTALVAVTALALTLVPEIILQANELLVNLPHWIELIDKQVDVLNAWVEARQLPINLDGLTVQFSEQLLRQVQIIASRAFDVAFETLGSIANVFLILVFTLVLTLSGDRVWKGLLSWLPLWWREQIQNSLRQTFENFISGQFIIATILTVLQTSAFLLLNIPFGLLFGVVIGIMSLIPLGGATSIAIIGLILTIQDFWVGIKVLVVTVILGQINETLIAPRILGNLVGLNPFWLLISLFLGARFAGPLGLFLAVPIASFIKILADAIRTSGAMEEIQ